MTPESTPLYYHIYTFRQAIGKKLFIITRSFFYKSASDFLISNSLKISPNFDIKLLLLLLLFSTQFELHPNPILAVGFYCCFHFQNNALRHGKFSLLYQNLLISVSSHENGKIFGMYLLLFFEI